MSITEIQKVLEIEAEELLNLSRKINSNFVNAVDTIYTSSGRVIISGIGKSGLIGQKIAATLNSTGTRAFFLHPVEAVHGDLGIVSAEDTFLALSNSGETWELNNLLHTIKAIGCKIIAFTGNTASTLAKNSDITIDVGVTKEACPIGLTPTASTTALLAAGDALAVALMNKKKFNSSDFKKNHPGGNLGQRLSANVRDIMLPISKSPVISANVNMKQAIEEINKFGLGIVMITENNKLIGIITDGDIRRLILKHTNILELNAKDIMTKNPYTVAPDTPAYNALNIMEERQIMAVPITDNNKKVYGLLHIHDILGKGEFKFNEV